MRNVFIYLMLGLFLFSFASALDFDNVISERTDIKVGGSYTIGDKVLPYNELWEEYKPIEIKNAFGLGGTLYKDVLTKHSDSCGAEVLCEDIWEVELTNEGALLDDMLYDRILEDGSRIKGNVRWNNFYYWGDVLDYTTKCSPAKLTEEEIKNETKPYDVCINVESGSHEDWVQFNIGDKFKAGYYKVKSVAEKRPDYIIDYIPVVMGKPLVSRATWGNISLGSQAEVVLNSPANNSIQYTNLVTTNATAIVTGGAYLVNATLYDNSTGSWGARNTSNYLQLTTENFTSSYSALSSAVHMGGANISVETNIYLKSITLNSVTGATRGIVYFANNLTLISVTTNVSGDNIYFNTPVLLSTGQKYIIGADNNGGNYVSSWSASESLPRDTGIINWNKGYYNGAYNDRIFGVKNITYINDYNTSTTQINTNTHPLGSNILWNMQFCDSDGACGFATSNYTFSIDSTAPTITLNYPTSLIDYGKLNGTLQLNFTATDTNLDKVYVSYDNTDTAGKGGNPTHYNITSGSIIANITKTLLGGSSNLGYYSIPTSCIASGFIELTSNSTGIYCKNNNATVVLTDARYGISAIFYDEIKGAVSAVNNLTNITLTDEKSIIIFANDTAGNLNATTFSWDYKVFENSQSYINQTYAQVSNPFIVNITSQNISSFKLNYNGTNYSANTFTSGSNTIGTVNILAPIVSADTNISFYWIYVMLDGSTINSDSKNQTIKYIVLGNTYSNLIYNISVKDEFTNAIIPNNNVTMTYEVTYGFTNTSILSTKLNFYDFNYSNKNISSNIFTSLYMTGNIIYSAPNYIGRTYNFLENYINSSKNITLYLTGDNISYVKAITVTDEAGRGQAATYKQYRVIGGVKTLVASETLSSTGKSTISFIPNVQYTFEFTKSGCDDLTNNIIFYDQSEYIQALSCTAYNPDDYIDPFEGMVATFSPNGVFNVNNATNTSASLFSVNISGTTSFCDSVSVVSFNVYDQLGNTIVNDNGNSCDVLFGSGLFNNFATGSVYILLDSGEEKTLTYKWVKLYSDADYANYSILTLLGEVGNSDDILGIDWKFKILISFIGLLGIIIALTIYQRIYNFSNLPILIVADIYIWFMCFIGWGDLNIGASSGGITALVSKYALLILAVIASAGIIATKEDEYS